MQILIDLLVVSWSFLPNTVTNTKNSKILETGILDLFVLSSKDLYSPARESRDNISTAFSSVYKNFLCYRRVSKWRENFRGRRQSLFRMRFHVRKLTGASLNARTRKRKRERERERGEEHGLYF